MKITGIILAKNEESKIQKTIESLEFCDEVLVIDDNSTDKTAEIVRGTKAQLHIHGKNNEFSGQRNWAMTQAKNEWILFIDADEEVTPELKEEIRLNVLSVEQSTFDAFSIPRRDFFWGHELRYGETRKARTHGIIRFVKKNSGVWAGAVHETYISSGSVGKLSSYLNHYSHDSISSFIQDINHYSSIRSEELYKEGRRVSSVELIFVPFGKFIYTYFILGGFLDGASGFVYSFVMSFHSFLVRAKLATKNYV